MQYFPPEVASISESDRNDQLISHFLKLSYHREIDILKVVSLEIGDLIQLLTEGRIEIEDLVLKMKERGDLRNHLESKILLRKSLSEMEERKMEKGMENFGNLEVGRFKRGGESGSE